MQYWGHRSSRLGGAPATSASALPPEPFRSAILTGLRYARYNPYLRATLIRTIAFVVFGSSYWALLPLVARTQIAGGAALYGVLLGVIGASAVGARSSCAGSGKS
jgi:hypothetical protein